MGRVHRGAGCFLLLLLQASWAAPRRSSPLLEVPVSLASVAQPIWANCSSAEFVMARTEFTLRTNATVRAAVAFVTAQQSPMCEPDSRLYGNNYGACLPKGGTSQPKLLGGYKLFVNGAPVGMGPGRRVNQTQGVDAIDITSALDSAGRNALGLQGYHTNAYKSDAPRMMLHLVLTYTDGTVDTVSTSQAWQAFDATPVFNPTGSSGAWAGSSGFPHEAIDMRLFPVGWSKPGFHPDHLWTSAALADPFVLRLGCKSALAAKPIAIFSRKAASVRSLDSSRAAAEDSTVLIDYGREMQGGVNLTFDRGISGQQISVKLSEELMPESCASPACATSVKEPMRTTNDFSDIWTLRDGPQTIMQHEYIEFRYAQVQGPADLIKQLTPNTARAWVVRYSLSDERDDQYGDQPMLAASELRPAAQMARFSSSNSSLDAVWQLVRHTIAAVSLDVNTDSNTRQRDLCHTDAYIAGIGQLAVSSDYGTTQMTAEDGFQLDSNIWQGTADFRAALISLAFEQALYSGDLSLVQQRYHDMQMHSLAGTKSSAVVGFFDATLGLVNKSAGTMGSQGGECPAQWSPAGMPPGIYEALKCRGSDLIDWPSNVRDGYVESSVGAVPNAYIALAANKVSRVARWLGKPSDQAFYANVSSSILENLRTKLYNHSTGAFVDGLDAPANQHASMHATLFAVMAGAVDEVAIPGMGLAVLNSLKDKGMACSCMAAYWLLEGLYKIGWHTAEAAEHALDVLTSDSKTSWLGMIAQGATASMEAWTREEKPNLTWSHPWCAGPNSIIIRLLLGVQPLELGWKRWQFAPQPASLAVIDASVPSLQGNIDISVANGGDANSSFSATLTVPKDTTARVCLPPAHGTNNVDADLEIDGKTVSSLLQGRMLCATQDLEPGAHTVRRV